VKSPNNERSLSLENGVFVIEFYTRWCGTCRAVTRHLMELEEEMGFEGILIDVEQIPVVAKSFLVRGVPVIVVLQDGIDLGRISGSLTKEEIRSWLLGFGVL